MPQINDPNPLSPQGHPTSDPLQPKKSASESEKKYPEALEGALTPPLLRLLHGRGRRPTTTISCNPPHWRLTAGLCPLHWASPETSVGAAIAVGARGTFVVCLYPPAARLTAAAAPPAPAAPSAPAHPAAVVRGSVGHRGSRRDGGPGHLCPLRVSCFQSVCDAASGSLCSGTFRAIFSLAFYFIQSFCPVHFLTRGEKSQIGM
jgi:hypothetical protein